MTVAPIATEERREAATDSTVTVTRYKTTWPAPQVEHSSGGVPQKPGFGARLAVRKFGAAINKLAKS